MRLAASVVLHRCNPELEVLVIRRADQLRFLSGFTAFPGGMVEESDARETPILTAQVCAERELSEELGLPSAYFRDRLSKLLHIGTWSTPEYLVARFQTYFFALEVDDDLPPFVLASEEIAHAEWVRPAELALRWERCMCLLAPPTQAIIRRLAEGVGVSRLSEDSETSGLPPRYSRIRPYITLFPQRTPTLPPATHTNCYLVGHDEVLIVEPACGMPWGESALRVFLEDLVESGRRLKAVVLTHHHHDHTLGIAPLIEQFGLEVWCHPDTASRTELPISRHLLDGDLIELEGGICLEVIHTPGHAPGHIVLLDDRSMSAIVGDMVAGVGTVIIDPDDAGDMAKYLESLERLRDLEPSCLLPSHGPAIGGAVEKLNAYVAHRLTRERKILEAVSDSDGTLKGIVEQAYAETPAVLRAGPEGGLAGRSARAHLHKLMNDGVVSQHGSNWQREDS